MMIRSYGPCSGAPSAPSSGDHLDVGVPGCVEVMARLGGDLRVNVDGGDLAGRAGQVREEGRVVAGSGADLEDAVAGAYIELAEHDGDDVGFGLWLTFDDRLALGEDSLSEQVEVRTAVHLPLCCFKSYVESGRLDDHVPAG
jgi:hypothetical protein